MDKFRKSYTSCITNLESQDLTQAFNCIRLLIQEINDWTLSQKLENLTQNYNLLLKYFREGIKDPQRKNLHNKIIKDCFSITDKVKYTYYTIHSKSEYSSQQRIYKDNQDLKESLKQVIKQHNSLPSISQERNKIQAEKDYEKKLDILFHQIWTSPIWEQALTEYFIQYISSPIEEKEIKLVLISAITLSTLYLFDENKVSVLIKSYLQEDIEIQERAFIGLILIILVHGNRLRFYPDIINAIQQLQKKKSFIEDLSSLQAFMLNLENAPNIKRIITEEIIPSIYNKLHHINIEEYLKDDESDMDEDSPVIKNLKSKIKDLYDMQKDNIDMPYFTFSHLKSFSFFQKTTNWFLPFRTDHSEITNHISEKNTLFTILSNSHNLCDSDLYSLCFFLLNLPETTKENIINNLKLQLGEYDLTNVFIEKNRKTRASIQRNYLENCIRYFQLYGNKNDFINPFNLNKLLFTHPILDKLMLDEDLLTNAAVYAHKQKMHDAVIQIYEFIDQNFTLKLEDLQLYGYHLQKRNLYEKAILCYEKASIIAPKSQWTLNNLGKCYIKNSHIQQAISIFTQLAHDFPENNNYIWHCGECYYLQGKYKKAISQFKKLEYFEEKSIRAIQAIAYCSLMDFNIEQASLYYTKLNSLKMTSEDYRNAGHTAWCLGNQSQAIDFYLKARNKDYFLFNKDEKFLLEAHGIDTDDILIMQDIVNQNNNTAIPN